MNRRDFLELFAGVLAVPIAGAAATAPEHVTVVATSHQHGEFPLYEGEIGRVEGVRIVEPQQYGDYMLFEGETSETMPEYVRVALTERMYEISRQVGKIISAKPVEYIWLPRSRADKSDPLNQTAYGGVKFWL